MQPRLQLQMLPQMQLQAQTLPLARLLRSLQVLPLVLT